MFFAACLSSGSDFGLVTAFDIKADVLVAMAIIAAICLQEWFAAGEVALIMEIGALLEDISAAKANKGIEHLASLMPVTGRVVGPDGEREVPVEEIPIGSIVRVRPGESVPVDGVIVSGITSIDQSVITGESVPVDRTVGGGVFSGTMNQMGASSSEAADIINTFAAASQQGSADVAYLNTVFEKAGTNAAGAKMNFVELAAATETIAPKFSSADVAGTNLNGLLLKLSVQANDKFKPAVVGMSQALDN